jgi:transposase
MGKKESIQELEQWIKTNPDSREIKRAIAVKLSLQGWVYEAISKTLNVSNAFVSKWKKRLLEQGIEGLKLSYKGAKSYLTKPQKEQVKTWLSEQSYWDLSELECYLIEQFDVVFKSQVSYYELLKEAKISWQKAQPKNPRKDPELVKKKTEEIQKQLGELLPKIHSEDIVLYALDEMHLLEGDLISHLWGDTEKRLKIPINNEKNRQTYYGALNLFKPELIIEEYDKGNGENTVKFVQKILEINKGKRVILYWDGAAYHRGEDMQKFLTEINWDREAKDWRVTCHLFAPYAPEQNPIEAIWLSLKNLLRKAYRFGKNFTIIKQIFKMLVEFLLFNFPNIKNYEAFSHLI